MWTGSRSSEQGKPTHTHTLTSAHTVHRRVGRRTLRHTQHRACGVDRMEVSSAYKFSERRLQRIHTYTTREYARALTHLSKVGVESRARRKLHSALEQQDARREVTSPSHLRGGGERENEKRGGRGEEGE